MFRYLERPELDAGDAGVGDMVSEWVSLGLPREGGGRELARDGGGGMSREAFSTSGEGREGVGGTTVASDLRLPDRSLTSLLGAGGA